MYTFYTIFIEYCIFKYDYTCSLKIITDFDIEIFLELIPFFYWADLASPQMSNV